MKTKKKIYIYLSDVVFYVKGTLGTALSVNSLEFYGSQAQRKYCLIMHMYMLLTIFHVYCFCNCFVTLFILGRVVFSIFKVALTIYHSYRGLEEVLWKQSGDIGN